jgi:hypothetical protein
MLQALRKINYKFDIIILTTILVISIIESAHIDIKHYNLGLENSPIFYTIPLFFRYELLKIAMVFFAVIRIPLHLKSGKWKKKYAITALVSILIFIGYWIIPFFRQPGAVLYLEGFEKWVIKNVDVDAVQTWILSDKADKYLGNRYFGDEIPSDLPDFIKDINPEWIDVYESEKGRRIEFMWVNGISESKGIVVGSPKIKTKQEGLIKHSNYDFQFRHSIKPGIYLVHGR